MREKFDLKHIAKQIDKYSTELNDEAKKIYDSMKKICQISLIVIECAD
jgi:hypothetical protein